MSHEFIIGVATNSNERFNSFVKSLNQTINKEEILLVIVDTTIHGLSERERNVIRLDYAYRHCPAEERLPYAEVMKLKVETVKHLCQEAKFYWNSDDDYIFNPYWYLVIKTLLEHSEIDYLSLLKIVRTIEEAPKDYSSFSLLRAYSCMGGAFGARIDAFFPVVNAYFDCYGIKNMFDQAFWGFLFEFTGRKDNVFTLNDFSLIQHCNLISSYLDQKGSKREHQYGIDFEPAGNPFNIVSDSKV